MAPRRVGASDAQELGWSIAVGVAYNGARIAFDEKTFGMGATCAAHSPGEFGDGSACGCGRA